MRAGLGLRFVRELEQGKETVRLDYEKCGKIVKQYSYQTGLDLSELFLRVVFSYIIGNSDMHLKNFSLIESAPGSRRFSLSAAYDMLPVNIVLPEDSEELALTLNGKKEIFAEEISLSLRRIAGFHRERQKK